jgi:ABC-type multidrug transport system ATPase subunit
VTPERSRGDAALSLTGVVRRFGRAVALDDLSFTVPRGSLCALVGENGAGKTTTLSILAGFLAPDAGTVDVLGLGPFHVATHRGRVGILPQDAELPGASTPRELLRAWAGLQGLSRRAAAESAEECLRTVQLVDRADDRMSTLSHGMRRRLTVGSALVGDPELILLDEPTAGLDPAQARHLRQALATRRGRATVLISSHNLPELESLCDHVVIIERGRCLRADGMDAVTGRDREVEVHLAEPLPAGRAAVVRLRLGPGDPRDLADATSDLLRELLSEGARVVSVRRGGALEERYFGESA